MPSTPLICCSSGIVTLFSTTSALAPGYEAGTRTVGGGMCGNCATGSRGRETAPASVIRIATTEAKTGRAMKKSTKAEPSLQGERPRARLRSLLPALDGEVQVRLVPAHEQQGLVSRLPELPFGVEPALHRRAVHLEDHVPSLQAHRFGRATAMNLRDQRTLVLAEAEPLPELGWHVGDVEAEVRGAELVTRLRGGRLLRLLLGELGDRHLQRLALAVPEHDHVELRPGRRGGHRARQLAHAVDLARAEA